jgi:hypothetical protein
MQKTRDPAGFQAANEALAAAQAALAQAERAYRGALPAGAGSRASPIYPNP